MEGGDSDAVALCGLPEVGVVRGAWATEFFLPPFFDERVEETPTDKLLPLPLLRFLITSVFRERGRTTPCSFRKRPQALQRGWPSGLRRHSGVVCVKQLVQVVGVLPCSPFLEPPGLAGREGAVLLNPDSGGVLGEVRDWLFIL